MIALACFVLGAAFVTRTEETAAQHLTVRGAAPPAGELDDLASLDDLFPPPAATLEAAHYPDANTMDTETALMTEESLAERRDEREHEEAFDVLCTKASQRQDPQVAHSGSTTSMVVSEVTYEYGDTEAAGHQRHNPHCEQIKMTSARTVKAVGDLVLPPFPPQLGEFDIAGLLHDDLGPEEYIKASWQGHPNKGLSTVRVDGHANGHPRPWVIVSKEFDATVKPALAKAAADIEQLQVDASGGVDPATVRAEDATVRTEVQDLLKQLEEQEKAIPFNHKLERIDLDFQKCGRRGCSALEKIYIHDGQLLKSSAENPTLDYVQASSSSNSRQTARFLPEKGLKTAAQHVHVEGAVNWMPVTAMKRGRCVPGEQPWLYVGMGTDSDADLDLGLQMYKWNVEEQRSEIVHAGEMYFSTSSQARGQILEDGSVKKRGECISGVGNMRGGVAVEYSGDDTSGSSNEGDDEWFFMNLDSLKQMGVTHFAVTANVYSGGALSSLEGAFMRMVLSDASDKAWASAKTVEYIDLDEIGGAAGSSSTGAVLMIFYLEHDSNIVLPQATLTAEETRDKARLTELITKAKTAGIAAFSPAEIDELKHLKSRAQGHSIYYSTVIAREVPQCTGSTKLTSPCMRSALERLLQGGFSKGKTSSKEAKTAEMVTQHPVVAEQDLDLDTELASLDDLFPPPVAEPVRPTTRDEQIEVLADRMSETQVQQELILAFPSGPPGSDVFCTAV